ncbi:hypothetical protein Bbelb_362290 [Branchiostoma belcheri]|nr:hypothetical protein Bbelb_362290 [Branchiostoma belcheri]
MPEKTRTTRESTRREAEVTGVVQKGGDSAAIMNELKSLSQKIDGMQSSLEKQLNKKVDSLRTSMEKMVTETKDELKAELERKTEEIGVNIDLEMGHAIEKKMAGTNKADRPGEFDPDESVIVSGLPFEEGEDIQAKIEGLLRTGIHSDVPVVAAERMKPRGRESCRSQGETEVIKGNPLYEKVFLRSAKSHTDRLIELNFRTLLWEISGGKDYFITGSERVKKRGARDLPADNNVSPQP